MAKKSELAKMTSIFGSVDKMNPDASILEDNSISTVNEWISTGCYALNAIISGSLYKGIPRGRITGFSGPSMSGKTFIINKCIANAQKEGYIGVIWDSEVAVDKKGAMGVGVDPSKVKSYPVESVEECRNQISTLLDNLIKHNETLEEKDKQKIIISIDSLGNLASSKELKDAEAGKDATDTGTRAKCIKSMMRVLTYKAAKAGVPILFSNHIYEGMEMFPSLVKTQSGGKGPIYLASVLVQLSTRNEKTSENDGAVALANSHNISGVTLGALTIKNRFVPSFLKTELYLNFKTGLDPYAGLFELAEAFEVIKKAEKGYNFLFNGESIGRKKEFEKSKEVWEKIMPVLEKVLNEKLCYGGGGDSEDIATEIEELEDEEVDDKE